jgi:hypothetical protein
MHAVVLTYVVHELGEPQDQAHEVELTLLGKERGVGAIRVDPALALD